LYCSGYWHLTIAVQKNVTKKAKEKFCFMTKECKTNSKKCKANAKQMQQSIFDLKKTFFV
jgi:hypothetical protein